MRLPGNASDNAGKPNRPANLSQEHMFLVNPPTEQKPGRGDPRKSSE